jgi:hypothetical protein
MINLLRAHPTRREATTARAALRPPFRPALECLEGRVVLSAATAAPAARQVTSILPVTINSAVNNAGTLVANASLGSTNSQVPLSGGTQPNATGDCPILNLHRGEIHPPVAEWCGIMPKAFTGVGVALLVGLVLALSQARAEDERRTAIVKAVDRSRDGIVMLKVIKSGEYGQREVGGTGVVIDERGFLLTNAHIVTGASSTAGQE